MKKTTIIAGSAAVAAALLSAGVVFAASANNSVNIGANGNVHLVGTISSISGSTWQVSSWGGTWTVNVASAQTMNQSSTTNFTTGEEVVVNGTASNNSLSVNANTVSEVGVTASISGDGSIKEHPGFWGGLVAEIRDRFGGWFGFGAVSNVDANANTFTLTNHKGQSETVDVNGSTTVKIGTSSPITGTVNGIVNGMHAFVFGSWNTDANTSGTASGTVSSSVHANTVVAGNGPVKMKAHGMLNGLLNF